MPAMYVQKRDGRSERVQYDKISARIEKLAYGLNTEFVDPAYITQKVIKGVYSGVTTVQLDTLAAETAAYLTTEHPDYSTLAARIAVSNLHKQTEKCFSKVMHELYHCVDKSSGRHAPLLADDVYQIITKNKEELDSAIIYDRDYSYDYFGFKVRRRTPARTRALHLSRTCRVSRRHPEPNRRVPGLTRGVRACADARALVPAQGQRHHCGAPAAHAHARVDRHPQE
jgi:hypothetical protein